MGGGSEKGRPKVDARSFDAVLKSMPIESDI